MTVENDLLAITSAWMMALNQNFGTHKELIVRNILKYKYRVNESRDMAREHFAKNLKLLTNWWPV